MKAFLERGTKKCVAGQVEKARMNSKSTKTHAELIGVKDYRGRIIR